MAEENENQHYYDLARERVRYQREQNELARQQQEAEELEEQEKSKIGWGVFLFALLLSIVADLAEFFTAGTLGWVVGFIVDLILLALLGLSKSGKKQLKKWIFALGLETIPLVDILPLRSLCVIWAFVSSRRPPVHEE